MSNSMLDARGSDSFKSKKTNFLKQILSVRCGQSVSWLNSDLDLLPQKEDIKRRHQAFVDFNSDKQSRPRKPSQRSSKMGG